MKYLLDTCCFLWMCSNKEKLSPQALKILEDRSKKLYLNQVSFWEIQIKYQSGKIHLKHPPEKLVKQAIDLFDLNYQRISDQAIVHLSKLPDHHRDPIDRLLIAHALVYGCSFITPDKHTQQYPVNTIWN